MGKTLQTVDLTSEYQITLKNLIHRVKQAQYNALKAFSSEKVLMAVDLGKIISERVKTHKWGDAVIANLAKDLQIEFAGVTGFSKRDLSYMRKLYENYFNSVNLPPLVAQISWSNNRVILDKCKSLLEAEYYIKKTIQNSWSKYDLIENINRKSYENSLLSQNNFNSTLEVSEEKKQKVAWDFRDDYGIELLNGENPFDEKVLEEAIMKNLNSFLLSMEGKFAFIGRQVKLVVESDEFFIDLLFFHFELNCYVVMELKATKFKPEHLGQLQGYMAIVNKTKKTEGQNPTIGILVCRDKNRLLVEYMLNQSNQSMGVATYNKTQLYSELSEDIREMLPDEKEIEKRLSGLLSDG